MLNKVYKYMIGNTNVYENLFEILEIKSTQFDTIIDFNFLKW